MNGLLRLLALTLLALIWADSAFEPQLRSSGALVVQYVQQFRFYLADLFFVLLGDGSYGVVVCIALIRHLMNDRAELLKTYLSIFACVWLTEVLKNFFADPRPYWASDVSAVNCSTGWGNPSGHATLLTGFGVHQAWLLSKGLRRYKEVVWGVAVSFIIIVEFDRIYLGVHFYSQLVLGTCIGLLVACSLIQLDAKLTGLFKYSLQLRDALMANALCFALFVVSLAVYLYVDRVWDESWSANIVAKCHSKKFAEYSASTSLVNSVLVLCPGALLLGLHFIKQSKEQKSLQKFLKLCVIAGMGLGLKQLTNKWSVPLALATTIASCYGTVLSLISV
mmetsp:Transcript_16910/g.30316  ORF Transcript_16910/g.30316 Transcript_16910/m.30316 type:complete len:335 (+) Transcript_16910:35-1039(+)